MSSDRPFWAGTGFKILIACIVLIVIPAVSFVGCGTSVYNQEVQLRNLHEANEDANKVVYNKFQKVIQEKAGVVNASVDAQERLFALIMNSKSGQGGGHLMKFIHENNPNPDQALTETSKQFKDIMVSIEGLRTEFEKVQKRSLDIERQHKDILGGFWSSKLLAAFGGDSTKLETQIVVGPETTDAFETGQDSGVDTAALFEG
ncbi:MAG: hypothetical protein QF805_03420 [Pirellulaceae bacterium]|jgi:hypothetical protein|nr:hypothetical protein [Pirellulaceae bacterium]